MSTHQNSSRKLTRDVLANDPLKQSPTKSPSSRASALNRREFITRVGGATAAAGAVGLPSFAGTENGVAGAAKIVSSNAQQRSVQAYQLRIGAAQLEFQQKPPPHPDNGDEVRHTKRIGNFSKGLPHNDLGEVDPAAYDALLRALSTGDPAEFESIPMGCPPPHRNLTNPQAGLAYDLEGGDAASFFMPPAPAYASAWRAGESVENYWMSLLRDVPFTQYENDALAQAAAADLSALSDFRGPRINGAVTSGTLFRNITP